jgi:hypothetical protein
MFDHSYDELFRAADILWPGEAGAILDNPTDEQLALILGVLTPSPCAGFGDEYGVVVFTGNSAE